MLFVHEVAPLGVAANDGGFQTSAMVCSGRKIFCSFYSGIGRNRRVLQNMGLFISVEKNPSGENSHNLSRYRAGSQPGYGEKIPTMAGFASLAVQVNLPNFRSKPLFLFGIIVALLKNNGRSISRRY
jgi:hypothetical protein